MRILTGHSLRRASVSIGLLAATTLAASAHAQNRDTAVAEALFRDARRLMAAGNVEKACPKLEESFRLVPKLGTLLNLATCHDKQGKTGSAWDEYTRAVTLAKEAGEQDRVEYARKELEALEARLAKISIDVTNPAPDLEVLVDGKPIGVAALGTPIPLDPGEHEIEARAAGQEPWRKKVTLPPGPTTLQVELPEFAREQPKPVEPPPPAPKPAPPPAVRPTEPDDPGAAQRAAGWVVGAIGIVGLGVGTGFGIDTLSKSADSDDHCDGTLCDQEGVDLRESANVSANVSNVGLGVGAAAVVVGIVLLATAPSGDETEEAGTPATARRWFAPVVSPSAFGLSAGGAW